MSEIKLLPCPFCGGKATITIIEPHKHAFATWMPDYTGGTFIECYNCSCSVSGETEEEAIGHWNTRKPMQDIVERLERERRNPNSYVYAEDAYCKAIEIVKEVGGMNE